MNCTDMLIGDVIAKMYGKHDIKEIERLKDTLCSVLVNYEVEKKCTDVSTWHGELPDCYYAFFAQKSVEGASEKTLALYKLYVDEMFTLVRKPIGEMTNVDMLKYFYGVEKTRKVSKRTLDNRRSALSSFFAWSAANGYIGKNPVVSIKPFKYERDTREPLDQNSMEKVRLCCKTNRERAIIEVLYSTACRVTELTRLDRKDVDFITSEVKLFGKGNKHRKSYLTEKAKLYLSMYLDCRNDDSDALFVSDKNPHDRLGAASIESIVKTVGKRAGIPLHPHLLRHTAATDAIRRGMDVTQLQKLLGHASLDTTMIYAKIEDDSVKNSHRRYLS